LADFAAVDDPYVVERVFAAAYGIAMRTTDPAELEPLAHAVADAAFTAKVPVHVLTRDYARGVLERAMHLGLEPILSPEQFRPPYRSQWPTVPDRDELTDLMPNWETGSHDSGDLTWARNVIGSSIMSGDFAYYVIGTNSSTQSSDWLSVPLAAPPWEPPPTLEQLRHDFESQLSEPEIAVWSRFTRDKEELQNAEAPSIYRRLLGLVEYATTDDESDELEPSPERIDEFRHAFENSIDELNTVLTDANHLRLAALRSEESTYEERRKRPGFDL